MIPRVILDSGAFTAARQGEVIDVREYIIFARRNIPLLQQLIVLDVIPDGRMDRNQITFAAEQSYRNQQVMKDAGLAPLPVVHQLDAPRWIERYLNDREPYIALAPKGRGSLDWLNQCFKTIAQASYRPKVHGLAVTNTIQLIDFPWTSVDSATWVKQAAVGRLLVPLFDRADRPLYNFRPRGVFVTSRMEVEPSHIDQLRDYERADVIRFLQLCNLSLNEVRQNHQARCCALIKYFQALQSVSGAVLHFVSNTSAGTRNLLLGCGARDHLLSYAVLRGQREGAIEKYVNDTVTHAAHQH